MATKSPPAFFKKAAMPPAKSGGARPSGTPAFAKKLMAMEQREMKAEKKEPKCKNCGK